MIVYNFLFLVSLTTPFLYLLVNLVSKIKEHELFYIDKISELEVSLFEAIYIIFIWEF